MLINGDKWMTILDNVLTPEECVHFITQLDNGLLHTVDSGMALYDRNILVSQKLADMIYERVIQFIPKDIQQNIAGINDHFRFSKYKEDGYFDIHQDGVNINSKGQRTFMTINIFLNSEFQGGETDFFNDKGLVYSAQPKAGRAAIFDRRINHRGNRVHGGFKYLLRTDFFYKDI